HSKGCMGFGVASARHSSQSSLSSARCSDAHSSTSTSARLGSDPLERKRRALLSSVTRQTPHFLGKSAAAQVTSIVPCRHHARPNKCRTYRCRPLGTIAHSRHSHLLDMLPK